MYIRLCKHGKRFIFVKYSYVLIGLLPDAEVSPEEKFKLYYVFKGPPKERKNKKLYYVYATSVNAKDEGIRQAEYRPQGKGYDWPESYRKANNLYYELAFLEQGIDVTLKAYF